MTFDVGYSVRRRIRKLLKEHDFTAVINCGPLYLMKYSHRIRYDADFIDRHTGEAMCYMEYESNSRIKKDLKWITEVLNTLGYPSGYRISS